LVAEYTFTKDRFVSGTASNTVHSDYGSFVWHLGIKNANKANADLRGPGVSEQPNDYSFDNRFVHHQFLRRLTRKFLISFPMHFQ
jgi:hypothetical protein